MTPIGLDNTTFKGRKDNTMANHSLLSTLKKDLALSANNQDEILNQYLLSAEAKAKIDLGIEIVDENNEIVKICLITYAKSLYFAGSDESWRYEDIYNKNIKTLIFNLDRAKFKKEAKNNA